MQSVVYSISLICKVFVFIINSIFSNHLKPLWYLRHLGLKAIDNIEPIKNLLKQYAMGKRFTL
ncbi:hypothetical protein [Candidatus Tisiphia endosymbiont of Ptychoptera albimana]|uniref:hypothetical protein n=1 Tax=Candidatus Tisiphia endosymbiont of Ptychoptera albimana TaxID=3066260 RepID=UPI001D49EAC5|nr:hypothetical protein [Rickettsia endosymbiont of Sericostoma sp. HW-2014]